MENRKSITIEEVQWSVLMNRKMKYKLKTINEVIKAYHNMIKKLNLEKELSNVINGS